MARRPHVVALVMAAVLACASCASIMQGTTQQVAVGSMPTGARIRINGQPQGTTPAILDLKRKDNHVVTVEAEGYEPYELALSRSVSGWVWGNIVFGGIVGLAVDAATGGMYKLAPEQVQAELGPAEGGMREEGDRLVLTVVLRPDPSWERVGTLTREEGR